MVGRHYRAFKYLAIRHYRAFKYLAIWLVLKPSLRKKIQPAQFYLNASVLVEICLNFGEWTGLVLVEGRYPEVKLRVDINIVVNNNLSCPEIELRVDIKFEIFYFIKSQTFQRFSDAPTC